jgi:hypothetical protein
MPSVLEAGKALISESELSLASELVSEKCQAFAVVENEGCFCAYNRTNVREVRVIWSTTRPPSYQGGYHAALDRKGNFFIRGGTPEQPRGDVIWQATPQRQPQGPPFSGELRDDGDFWLHDGHPEAGPYWTAFKAPLEGPGSIVKAPPLSKTAGGTP